MRETLAIGLSPAAGALAHAAICESLMRGGFTPARIEPEYVEARRGTARPFRVVSLMSVEDTPVVVCVSISRTDAGAMASVAAYPDLGGNILMGPIARRKWRAAMREAVGIVADATRSVGQAAQR